jgi:hypothetical protein
VLFSLLDIVRFLLILCSATCPRGRGKGVVVSCSLLDQQQSQQIINITQPLKTQAQATINQQYKFISMQRNTFIYMKSACINRPSAHHSHLPLFSFSYFNELVGSALCAFINSHVLVFGCHDRRIMPFSFLHSTPLAVSC